MISQKDYGLGGGSASTENAIRWWYLALMLFLFIGAFGWASQRVGAYYGFHPALGYRLLSFRGDSLYFPWAVMVWEFAELAGRLNDPYGFIEKSATFASMIFLAPQFVILGYWVSRRKLRGNTDLHGSAHWAMEKDIQGRCESISNNTLIYLSNYYIIPHQPQGGISIWNATWGYLVWRILLSKRTATSRLFLMA